MVQCYLSKYPKDLLLFLIKPAGGNRVLWVPRHWSLHKQGYHHQPSKISLQCAKLCSQLIQRFSNPWKDMSQALFSNCMVKGRETWKSFVRATIVFCSVGYGFNFKDGAKTIWSGAGAEMAGPWLKFRTRCCRLTGKCTSLWFPVQKKKMNPYTVKSGNNGIEETTIFGRIRSLVLQMSPEFWHVRSFWTFFLVVNFEMSL